MTVKIGSARISENNTINGVKGDSTGKEVAIENFYMHELGWYCLRPKDSTKAKAIAENMIRACNNDNIGYSQKERSAIWYVGTGTTEPTNCDCSSLGSECIREAGIPVENFTTANAVSKINATGAFEKKFEVTNANQLKVGDCLVTKKKGHFAIVVETSNSNVNTTSTNTSSNSVVGIDSAKSFDKTLAKTYTTTANVNIRSGASVAKRIIKTVPKDTKVKCYGYYTVTLGTKWYYVKCDNITGFISSKYCK